MLRQTRDLLRSELEKGDSIRVILKQRVDSIFKWCSMSQRLFNNNLLLQKDTEKKIINSLLKRFLDRERLCARRKQTRMAEAQWQEDMKCVVKSFKDVFGESWVNPTLVKHRYGKLFLSDQ